MGTQDARTTVSSPASLWYNGWSDLIAISDKRNSGYCNMTFAFLEIAKEAKKNIYCFNWKDVFTIIIEAGSWVWRVSLSIPIPVKISGRNGQWFAPPLSQTPCTWSSETCHEFDAGKITVDRERLCHYDVSLLPQSGQQVKFWGGEMSSERNMSYICFP